MQKVIESSIVAYLGNEDSPDISNPIHSTAVAKKYGFNGPIVGGVTVWGWATDTIIAALGKQWLGNGWAEYSFRQPVYPGDTMSIKAIEQTEGSWLVEMANQTGGICVSGKVGLGMAEWTNNFVRPKAMNPSDPPQSKGPLVLAQAKTGIDWVPMEVNLSVDLAREFLTHKQITDNPIFSPKGGIAHPSWIAGWAEQLLRHNYEIPTSMHTKSLVQHHSIAHIGETLIGGAYFLDVYERKGHHFANFDVLLTDGAGRLIAQMRHWTIFRIATPGERNKTV